MVEQQQNGDILCNFKTANQKCIQILQNFDKIKFEDTQRKLELEGVEKQLIDVRYNCQGPQQQQFVQALESQKSRLINKISEIDDGLRTGLTQLLPSIGQCLSAGKVAFNRLKRRLDEWKISQKLAQIGPREDGKNCYNYLVNFDKLFGEMEVELQKMITSTSAVAECTNILQDQTLLQNLNTIQQQIFDLVHEVAYESIVVSRQPPTFLMPGRETKAKSPDAEASSRGMRHPCVPRIRVLGNENFGFRDKNALHTVKCKLVTEDEALKFKENKNYVSTKEPIANIPQCVAQFGIMSQSSAFQAVFHQKLHFFKFDDKEKKTNIPRPWKRYYLIFEVQLSSIYHGGKLEIKKNLISLPVSVYSNIIQRFEQGGDAALWWQLAFCEGDGVLSPEAARTVPIERFMDCLERKLKQLIEEPDGPFDPDNPDPAPPGFQEVAKRHIASKLCDKSGNVSFDTFWLNKCCLKMNEKTKKEESGTFREWFYSCALTINKFLQVYWKKNLITGFCDKDDAFRFVSANPDAGTMMIRFSDTRIGYIMITHYLPQGKRVLVGDRPSHIVLKSKELEGMNISFAKVVHNDNGLRMVDFIYPNIPRMVLHSDDPADEPKKVGFGYETIMMSPTLAPEQPLKDVSACQSPVYNFEDILVGTPNSEYSIPEEDFDPNLQAAALFQPQVQQEFIEEDPYNFAMQQAIQF